MHQGQNEGSIPCAAGLPGRSLRSLLHALCTPVHFAARDLKESLQKTRARYQECRLACLQPCSRQFPQKFDEDLSHEICHWY